jgi:hypothetical protein
MWVRLWVQSNCASGINSTESKYEWFVKKPSDEELKDYAQKFASSTYYWDLERGCKYGFDRLKHLPVKVREELILKYKNRIKGARNMLKILKA